MPIRVECKTYFDITVTGVRNNYKPSGQPLRDRDGQEIGGADAWNKARNQQRNWETLNQIMALRTLPENIKDPVEIGGVWTFEFEIPDSSALETHNDVLGLLKADAAGVPMIVRLDEPQDLLPYLVLDNEQSNIWFSVV